MVPGDAVATARNITDHAFMFRLGIAADLSTFVCAVALTVILYVLLKPVNRNAALLMLGFNLVQDAIGGLNALNTYRPLQTPRRRCLPEGLQSAATGGDGLALAQYSFHRLRGCADVLRLFVPRPGLSHPYFWLSSQSPRRADGDCGRAISRTALR